jgi:hypothetical protein
LEKRFEPAFNRSLRAFFEDSRGKCRRLLRNGDVIAVSVPEIPVDTRDGEDNEVEEQTKATMWVELLPFCGGTLMADQEFTTQTRASGVLHGHITRVRSLKALRRRFSVFGVIES